MSSKDKILTAILANQPPFCKLPEIEFIGKPSELVNEFTDVLTSIGGKVIKLKSTSEVCDHIGTTIRSTSRVLSDLPFLAFELIAESSFAPHTLSNVDLAIFGAHLGVAENGAIWVTEGILVHRVLPFICQHLAIVLNARDIVPTMHEAYERIDRDPYGFGTFIAGPSKTADIEQSLVLGAHGARSMTVYLIS